MLRISGLMKTKQLISQKNLDSLIIDNTPLKDYVIKRCFDCIINYR